MWVFKLSATHYLRPWVLVAHLLNKTNNTNFTQLHKVAKRNMGGRVIHLKENFKCEYEISLGFKILGDFCCFKIITLGTVCMMNWRRESHQEATMQEETGNEATCKEIAWVQELSSDRNIEKGEELGKS